MRGFPFLCKPQVWRTSVMVCVYIMLLGNQLCRIVFHSNHLFQKIIGLRFHINRIGKYHINSLGVKFYFTSLLAGCVEGTDNRWHYALDSILQFKNIFITCSCRLESIMNHHLNTTAFFTGQVRFIKVTYVHVYQLFLNYDYYVLWAPFSYWLYDVNAPPILCWRIL